MRTTVVNLFLIAGFRTENPKTLGSEDNFKIVKKLFRENE